MIEITFEKYSIFTDKLSNFIEQNNEILKYCTGYPRMSAI